MAVPLRHYKELCELFATIQTPKEADMLLKDILTPQEIESIVERWQLIRQLASGKPQRDVARDLKVSISKITRGSRVLQYGTGGFLHFLDKMKKRHPKKHPVFPSPSTRAG
ncbi:MAG: Trp family transcriptional regulator [Candidatus Peregrinibacteria bacterium]